MGISPKYKGRHGHPASLEQTFDAAMPEAYMGQAPATSLPPTVAAPKPLYLCQPFVRSTLIKGSFRTIVALPKYVNPYEWIAVNCTSCCLLILVFDLFHNLNQFCGVIAETCTPHNFPTMSAGVGLHYTWVDVHRKPIHLPAAQYIDFVMTWIGQLLNDEAVFPTKPCMSSFV